MTQDSSWLQHHFQVSKDASELCEAYLWAAGALSVTMSDAGDQPLLEPAPHTSPLWDDIIVTGLFSKNSITDVSGTTVSTAPALTDDRLADIASRCNASRAWSDNLAEQVWETAWMEHFHPIDCGEGLWIVPKWLDAPEPTATNILIDPGLAFGTGHHASTRLCLNWLAQQNLTNKLVVDYGCGSGILAIAALLLGAAYAYAVDIDAQAVTATKQNALLNGVEDRLWAGLPEAFDALHINNAQIITANILAKPLISLAEHFSTLCDTGCDIVLAGIIKPQLDDVKAAYTPWFEIADTTEADKGDWVRLALVRQ